MREDKYAHEMVSPIADSTPPPPPPPPSQFVAAQGSGLSRRARRTIIAVVVIVIVLIGIIGYAAAGFAFTTTRVAIADKSLNSVISHQNSLNTTFKDINTKFNALSSGTASDPKQAHTLIDQFVVNAKSAGTTVDKDDASLLSAKTSLKEQQWLTLVGRGNLDKEQGRIDHARKALAEAKTIAGDYVQDGEFIQAFLDAMVDLDTFDTQSANADLTGAKGTLASMSTHVNKALQLSSAPGLPTELHSLMADFQTLVADFGKLLDAVAANNDQSIIAAGASVSADADKIGTYNFDKISTQIDAYYKPLVDTFNSEMAKATAS